MERLILNYGLNGLLCLLAVAEVVGLGVSPDPVAFIEYLVGIYVLAIYAVLFIGLGAMVVLQVVVIPAAGAIYFGNKVISSLRYGDSSTT